MSYEIFSDGVTSIAELKKNQMAKSKEQAVNAWQTIIQK